MMYVECPQRNPSATYNKKLFLAGGITNCRDWQSVLVKRLMYTDLTVFNPRRKTFECATGDDRLVMMEEQIEWEFDHLNMADAISFWFEPHEIQPITLFELGRWSATAKPLFIGCDPDYPRINDVLIQMELARPGFHVVTDLNHLGTQIIEHFYEMHPLK